MLKLVNTVGLLLLSLAFTASAAGNRDVDECGGLYDESDGLLVYSYNKEFPKEDCVWTVSSSNESSLGALEFTLLSHGFTPEDYFDDIKFFYIEVNGSITYAGLLNGRSTEPVIVDSRVVFISFGHYHNSPLDTKATGFILQFKGVAATSTGGNTQIPNTGRFFADLSNSEIRNFTYPPSDTAPNQNEYATFVIQNRPYYDAPSMHLTIDNVQLLGRCTNDALQLYAIRDTGFAWTWRELGTICSTGVTYDIVLKPGLSLVAVFRSNGDQQYDSNNFRLSWSESR